MYYGYVCGAQLIQNLELLFYLSNNGAENTKLWLAAIHRRAVIILMRAFIAQIK